MPDALLPATRPLGPAHKELLRMIAERMVEDFLAEQNADDPVQNEVDDE